MSETYDEYKSRMKIYYGIDVEKDCMCKDQSSFLTVPESKGFKIICPKCKKEIKD